MDKKILVAVAIGIGLAASCGFRVFVSGAKAVQPDQSRL